MSRPVAAGVIDQRCDCDEPATWVRDDDTLFCDGCKEDDKSGMIFLPLRRRWSIIGGYDGALHALFVTGGPWLDPGGSTPTEAMSPPDARREAEHDLDLPQLRRELQEIAETGQVPREYRSADGISTDILTWAEGWLLTLRAK